MTDSYLRDPTLCEPAKYQSEQKPNLLEAYYRIWKDNVSGGPTLQVAELHAGSGYCYNEKYDRVWRGTAIRSAECARDYEPGVNYPNKLFLNCWAPDEDEREEQMQNLRGAIDDLDLAGEGVEVEWCSKPAREAVHDAKDWLDPNYPNFWVLDPYKLTGLRWKTTEEILQFKGQRYDRVPEIFATFMSHEAQRFTNFDPRRLAVALGENPSGGDWLDTWRDLQDNGLNAREAAVELYSRKLEPHFDYNPIPVKIPSEQGNIVYVVFCCFDRDEPFHMMSQEALAEYEYWWKNEWAPLAERNTAAGQQAVTDF